MADYITANRWITGVETHKTRRGRILCTGIGCIGCFPEDYPAIARELEVYDSKTALIFGADLSNEMIVETRMGCGERQQRPTETNETNDKNDKKESGVVEEDEVNCRETSDAQSVRDIIADSLGQESDFERLFLTECTVKGTLKERNIGSEEKTDKRLSDDKFCKESTDNPVDNASSENFTDQSLSLRLNIDDKRVVDREDCVCLFFALEYYRGARILPDLSILEIVSALNTLMHINEMKCVQRLNGIWHIVLRTRKHLRRLLSFGITIRGRWYQMVQDNDMYCDKVY